MKTALYLILIVLAILIYACSDTELINESVPNDFRGKVVFQEVTTQAIKLAEVNSMRNSTSYDNAMPYTRPVWSHDGSKFAAIELRSNVEANSWTSDFVIKIVDTESADITTWEIGSSIKIELDGPFTWSPDGKTIAFLTHPYNKIIYLNTQNGDTVQTEFLNRISGGITALDWHPDGNIAVNISYSLDFRRMNEIWMLEPYKTTLKNKISASAISAFYGFEYIEWNEEGSKLLLSTAAHHNEIGVLDSNTGEYSNIPNVRGLAACWSPGGEYIMYTGSSGHIGLTIIPGLFVTDLQGSFEKLLIPNAGYSDWH